MIYVHFTTSPSPGQCTDCLDFPVVFEQIRQPVGYKKAPEGGCSPGKKGLMILYLFVVVGVLDLERNCHVAMLAISLDNNANVCPSAILVDIDICIGIDLLRDLVQNETQYRILIGEVRRHENRQILFVLTLTSPPRTNL